MPQFISAADTAEKWGITKRRVTLLCSQGRIPGVFRLGMEWAIPADAEKPPDARIKSGKYIKNKSDPSGDGDTRPEDAQRVRGYGNDE